MSKLTFYVQQRVDGGRRTGIDIDGETVFEHFEAAGEEFDPALLWYVDIRCVGNLPSEPDRAKQWLLDQMEPLRASLQSLGQELEVGLDSGLWPLQRKVEAAPPGVEIAIVCSSLRRVATRDFGQILSHLASQFPAIVNSLGRIEAAAQ